MIGVGIPLHSPRTQALTIRTIRVAAEANAFGCPVVGMFGTTRLIHCVTNPSSSVSSEVSVCTNVHVEPKLVAVVFFVAIALHVPQINLCTTD